MALIVDQQSNFKHFCKICKKGFGCGRALGGHMRAHGIGDESVHIDDEDPASDWEDKLGGNVPASNKRMYALRTNPNRLKSCRVCENCGKEFLSWKSFLEHGKCTSEDAESLVSSPGSDGDGDGDDGNGRRGCGWSKRKRSMRAKVGNFNNSNCPSSEEEDLANCLMMLSNANVDNMVAEAEESCASASKEEERRNTTPMNFIPPISYKVPLDEDDDILDINIINNNNHNNNNNNKNKGVAKGLFECKACKKVFNSHQALGGHRASHKKVKGCYAARLDHVEDSLADDDVITHEEFFPTKSNSTFQQLDHQGSNTPLASTSKRKSKVHECSICHRVFSSGQALGGHKRCHWITSNGPDSSALSKFHQFPDQLEPIMQRPKFDNSSELLDLKLDLNLPAPIDDVSGARHEQIINPTNFGVSTDIFLQSWIAAKENEENNHHHHHHHHHLQSVDIDNNDNNSIVIITNSNNNNNINNNNNNNNNSSCSMQNVEDEADSKVKLAKLSELKDMNMSGSSSPWLQVGIGSTTDVAADP